MTYAPALRWGYFAARNQLGEEAPVEEADKELLERIRKELWEGEHGGLIKEHQTVMHDLYGSQRRGGQTGVVQLLNELRADLTSLNQRVETWFAQITAGLKVAIALLAGGFILGIIQFARDLLAGRL